MIQFSNVSKRYQSGQDALLSVSFTLDQGEMAFLTGHSGAGKSTLLKLIALLETASSGAIVVQKQNLSQIKRRGIALFRRKIGLIFQNPMLLFDRSILENVALPLVIAGSESKTIHRRARAALDLVGLLNKERLTPEMLSCGEQQRVGIARAIVTKPSILLADEPTGNLDPSLSWDIMKLFKEFNQTGTTVLIASHDLELINQMQCRNLVLKEGVLIEDRPKGTRL